MRISRRFHTHFPGLLPALCLFTLTIVLTACGGGGSSTSSAAPDQGADSTAGEVTFFGSVGDGPVTGAHITLISARGFSLGTIISDDKASYRAVIKPEREDYPLRLIVSNGIDLVTGRKPDFQMESTKAKKSSKIVNINPFSTLVTKVARHLPGGLSIGNINRARALVMNRLTFGLDMAALPDPISSKLTANNVADLVKASEAFGEAIRRTRDRIIATGRNLNGNTVMDALAADMVDGRPDGLGATGTDARITAVFNVVTAQVLVELLSNNLRVGGVIATNVIDQSILSTYGRVSSSQLTGGIRVTADLLDEARSALSAVNVIDGSVGVALINQALQNLNPGATTASIATRLSANSTNLLSNAVNNVAYASTAQVNAINQGFLAGGDTGTVNSGMGNSGTGGAGSGGTGATGNGSFNVNWTAPTTRSDGSPLSLAEIDGYLVYYGRSSGSYPNRFDESDGAATSATINNLASGTYYLVMTTYDDAGRESTLSPEVIKYVP